MKNWLIERLGWRIQHDVIFAAWWVEIAKDAQGNTIYGSNGKEVIIDSSLKFNIDDMLTALYGEFGEDGELLELIIPEEGSYEALISGDPDGAKGYKEIFEQWHAEGVA